MFRIFNPELNISWQDIVTGHVIHQKTRKGFKYLPLRHDGTTFFNAEIAEIFATELTEATENFCVVNFKVSKMAKMSKLF